MLTNTCLHYKQLHILLYNQITTCLFTSVLRIVLNIDEFISLEARSNSQERGCTWLKFWTIIAVPVSHLFLQINSSVNIFIYCYFNPLFRKVLVSKLIILGNFLKLQTYVNTALNTDTQPTIVTRVQNHKNEIRVNSNARFEEVIELNDLNITVPERAI